MQKHGVINNQLKALEGSKKKKKKYANIENRRRNTGKWSSGIGREKMCEKVEMAQSVYEKWEKERKSERKGRMEKVGNNLLSAERLKKIIQTDGTKENGKKI